MPFETRYYNLEAFKWGEIYSAKVDKRRFTIIDNQIAFISDMVGPGVIYGFDIVDNEDGTILINPGLAMIGRKICQSFGGQIISLSSDMPHYIYAKSKSKEVGGVSGNSNIASVVGFDDDPPSAPSSLEQELSIIEYLASLSSYDSSLILYLKNMMHRREEDDDLELVGYKEVAFKWYQNTEPDFDYYQVKRIDGSNEKVLGTTVETIYVDTNLEQNHEYTYQVTAIDLSGNESSISSITVQTDEDTRVPQSPSFVQVFSGDQRIEVIWDNSPTDNVLSYRIVIQPVDDNYNDDGDPTSVDVDSEASIGRGSTYAIFENLENNRRYKITVYSVSVAGVLSEGVSTKILLNYIPGAGEVNDISAEFIVSSFDNVGIEANVSWRYQQTDPYLPYAYKFLISFIENGKRVSEDIEVLESDQSISVACADGDDLTEFCYTLNIKYIPYMISGRLVYESIKEYTPYIIIIKTEDEDGNVSSGFIHRVNRTIVSETVSSISNFSIERKADNSVFMKWSNPLEEYFSYNKISIRVVDLGTDDTEGYLYSDNIQIDKSESFIIPSSDFNVNNRYDISITSYDVFGSIGETYETSEQFFTEDTLLRPSSPSNLSISSGDAQLYLRWDRDMSVDREIASYKIYRSVFSVYLRSSDFSVISTVSSTRNSFIDYSVINGVSYSYFVTSVDIYGNESINPDDDNYVSSFIVSCTPFESLSLSPPSGLIVSANSNHMDAEIRWDASSGSFDGYEILRSDGNNYSFSVIDYVPISQTFYIDENSLLRTGEIYYYIVRKYKNEVDLVVLHNDEISSDSVLIGVVTTSNGVSDVSIDVSSVVHLENFEDPITLKTEEALSYHHHTNDYVDKRIELRASVRIDDWETLDYQVYTTDQDIEGANGYFLTISGEINESYFTNSSGVVDVSNLKKAQSGESPILYEIDTENNKIIFNSSLFSSDQSFNAPYLSAPSLLLDLSGISEIDNYLPESKLGNLSATQFESGQLESSQISSISHEGRIGEPLNPIKVPLKTLDNFVFSISSTYEDEDRNKIGNAVSFYDVILIEEERLLASTSNGVWLSENYGEDWSSVISFPSPVSRLYKSSENIYYALTNYGVYKNEGDSFRSWSKMDGLDFVKVIRDITEDSDKNLYISSDLGVFKLNSQDIPYIHDCWEKMPIFGPESSESYAIIYDSNYVGGRIIVSNELGLIHSTDSGRSWVYIAELDPFIKIRKFRIEGNYLFALSDNAIYREVSGEISFEKIADLDSNRSGTMEIYRDTIYVTTDNGGKRSSTLDIYTDTNVDMVSEFSIANIRNQIGIITSLNVIEDNLFVGCDRKLFIKNSNDRIWVQFEQKNSVIPSFYVDNDLVKIGFYYNNLSEQNVGFDEIVDHESKVYVCNKYDIYVAENQGWADNKYDATFIVYKNDLEFGRSRDSIPLDMNQFSNVIFPEYDDNNAHKEMADVYKSQVQSNLSQIISSSETDASNLPSLISDTYNKFELFLSQIYEDARVVTDSNGNEKDFTLPSINTDLIIKRSSVSNLGETTEVEENVYKSINDSKNTNYSVLINIVNGLFSFDIPFDRYDNLTVDIFGVSIENTGEYSHREVEDVFEILYSGPPSYLSQVQQANIVKLGIFSNRVWPGEQNEISAPLQMSVNIPTDYDGYDALNSTFNYLSEVDYHDTNLSLFYPSSVLYVQEIEKVFVGGFEGVLSIDASTIDIEKIDFGNASNQMVRSIFMYNSSIYILVDKNIFVSDNYGASWSDYNKNGLPNQIYCIGGIGNNLVVGASDGVYIKMSGSDAVDWEKVMPSSAPVTIMCSSNILFVVIDRKIYYSSNGFNYTDSGLGANLDITNIIRYGYTNLYVATAHGLYSDNGTFNSITPILQVINLKELIDVDGVDTINDVSTNNDDIVSVAISNGTYGVIENNSLRIKEFTSLDSIHKIIVIDDEIWLFGQDSFKIPRVGYPIKLTTGAPF